jgi:transcriptional regulator with XRE-family HTH domain
MMLPALRGLVLTELSASMVDTNAAPDKALSASDPTHLPLPHVQHAMRGIGESLRTLRKSRGLTLDELSRRSGVSSGLVSQLERGIGNPAFGTLLQLAHGLDISVGQMIQVPDQDSVVVRADERRLLPNDDGAKLELVTPGFSGSLEAVWSETPAGYDTSANPLKHKGEEFGLVISGSKDVFLDGVQYRLGPGDSITYSSLIPHWYKGDEACTSIWVVTPPSW